MRKGHRRTQSATITPTHSLFNQASQHQQPTHYITALLAQSELHTAAKITQVEVLEAPSQPTTNSNNYFRFGKGTMKTTQTLPNCLGINLNTIPQGPQQGLQNDPVLNYPQNPRKIIHCKSKQLKLSIMESGKKKQAVEKKEPFTELSNQSKASKHSKSSSQLVIKTRTFSTWDTPGLNKTNVTKSRWRF